MKMPPSLLLIRTAHPGRKTVSLRLPIFLLWPLLLILLLIPLMLALLADLITFFRFALTRLTAGIFPLLGEIRGTSVGVSKPDRETKTTITIL